MCRRVAVGRGLRDQLAGRVISFRGVARTHRFANGFSGGVGMPCCVAAGGRLAERATRRAGVSCDVAALRGFARLPPGTTVGFAAA